MECWIVRPPARHASRLPLGEIATLWCSARSLIREPRTSLAISVAARVSAPISVDGAASSRDISLYVRYHVLDTVIM